MNQMYSQEGEENRISQTQTAGGLKAKLCVCKSLVAMKTSRFNPNGCIAKGCCIVQHSSQVMKIKVHITVHGV